MIDEEKEKLNKKLAKLHRMTLEMNDLDTERDILQGRYNETVNEILAIEKLIDAENHENKNC